ncbi:oligopeptide transporter 3-like isoform X3 [Quercus lobata]|uniref:oligopeptide transporter 3-like isoform X3 n=1 Tax=Quercus lobata TaxID=97700 RepID=UPI001245FB44|nr:oligopeptide transporter 3-like isoform X3 [Quercus lobata]XP_030952099.1 oligopeptide transporter 3-like isoform X3 [Quercus lobata]
MTFKILGYGWAGMLRRYLVDPVEMSWPAHLAQVSLFRKAIKDLSAGLGIENDDIECLYLRASCYHAIGEYREVVKDYDAA